MFSHKLSWICRGKIKKQTLFSKKTAYAALVESWPSKNRGNSTGREFVETAELDVKSDDDGSTEGA